MITKQKVLIEWIQVGNKIYQNMDKQSCFICDFCQSTVELDRKQYHEQYECFKRIQQKRRQNKKLNIKISQSQLINYQQQKVKQSKKIMKGKGKSQTQSKDQKVLMRKINSDMIGSKLFEEKQWMGRKQEKNMMQKALKGKKGLQVTKKSSAIANGKRASAKVKRQLSGDVVQCSICMQMIELAQIEQHEFQCTMEVECEYCGVSLSLTLLQQHYDVCQVGKLWQQEQQKKQYGKNGGYSAEQLDYGNEYYEEEYSQSQSWSQGQYQRSWSYEQQWSENKPKHKGLAKSKLDNLCYTSYRKPLETPSTKQQTVHTQKQQQNKQTPQEYEPCPICYINFQDSQTIIKLPCLHGYHPECVGKWFQTDDRCPCCKVKVQ